MKKTLLSGGSPLQTPPVKTAKKLGLMQPYFFPYLGYFSLIKNTDYFIFFDTPQYLRRGWMNRNRILNSSGEPAYITVPVQKAPQVTAIRDIQIDYSQDWASSMIARMGHYKRHAPNYEAVTELFQSLLFKRYCSLAELNIETTTAVCRYLGIGTPVDTLSKMELNLPKVSAPGEWALNITKELGYGTYRNPPGGMPIYDQQTYSGAGINLGFLQVNFQPYDQGIGKFVESLSILDVMMFNSKEQILQMLDDFTLLTK